MTDGPSAAKKSKVGNLPKCPYGARCYRKNPNHFLEYDHDKDAVKKPDAVISKRKDDSANDLPQCIYGAKCYRKNLLHFAEYSHATAKAGDSEKGDGDNDDSGSDTDVIDSEDESKSPQKDSKDIVNRGMSLVKSFSQMTEAERKELIKKAFEVKEKLKKELEETKKQVEKKDKELNKLQEQVNTGLLLLDGEKEALEGTKTVYFTLKAERAYKEGSAAQIHFRLAESQFYRLLSGPFAQSYRVYKVEYVVNPKTYKLFTEAQEKLKKTRDEEHSYPVLAFHGTKQEYITPICESGFKVPGEKVFSQRTDTGWYGGGVYFSEFPGYSMSYIQGSTKLLLCQVLTGKVYHCTQLIHGAKLQDGYDSHTSPDKKELVIFNSAHILPSYIVHYGTPKTDFQYVGGGLESKPFSTSNVTDVSESTFDKAVNAKATNVFKGQKILICGTFKMIQKAMKDLIVKHKGVAATVGNMMLLVASEDQFEVNSNKVENARKKGVPIVKEEFIYDCINAKTFLDMDDYIYED